MKKTGKGGLGHLKKIEKRDHQVIAEKGRIEMIETLRREKRLRRRSG